MKKSYLGKTNLLVSSLGLGGASLGTKVYKEVAESVGIEIVKKAFELGINWVDVSPFYGITKAETTLGRALQQIQTPREQYYIATKCGRYGDQEFDFSAERVTRSLNESLQRLQIDYVDLLQCHDIEFTDLDQIINETLPALRRIKESGKARYIGITGYPLKIFKYILEKDEDEIVDTVLSYCHYSLNNTQLNDLIPFLEDKKVGIINAAPLSMGLLTAGGPPSWHPASPQLKEVAKKAVEYCQSKQVPIEKLALQFSASNDHIHSTLIGSGSLQEVETNVKWFQEVQTTGIDTSLVREVQSIFGNQMNKPWITGKPENNL